MTAAMLNFFTYGLMIMLYLNSVEVHITKKEETLPLEFPKQQFLVVEIKH